MWNRLVAPFVLAFVTPLAAAAQVAAPSPSSPSAVLAPTAGAPAAPAAAVEPAVASTPVAAAAPRGAALAVAAGPAVAAAVSQAETPQAAQAPEPVQPVTPAPSVRSRTRAPRPVEVVEHSKGINVRIDATVIESRGDLVTGRKVLTVTLVDGEWGSVRSSQQVPFRPKGTTGYSYRSSPLNMDAKATLRDDGRIRVALTLEYRGVPLEDESAKPAEAQGPPAAVVALGAMDEGIKQNVAVVLESGKPLIVAQSADAVGDRRVALEVKATVLK